MVKESIESKKIRVLHIIRGLKKDLPDAKIALDFSNPLQLLVATILSAQCTDKRVNLVTPAVFKKYKSAQDYAQADPKTFQELIRSTGFYKAKARNILACAKRLVECYEGKVPGKMEELVTLPGVGRKTANVILGNIFGVPGLVVDTHMIRVSNRLHLTHHTDAVKIELELNEVVPKKEWTQYSHLIIHHGRKTCVARKPRCAVCCIKALCPSRQDLTQVPVGLQRRNK